MTSMRTGSVVNFPREKCFVGCDNGRGIHYGSLVTDSVVPENYRDAVLALRHFFSRFTQAMKVDVTYDDDGSPVISISGDPGERFSKEFKLQYGYQEGLHWKAIHKIVDPLEARLNPNLMFGWGFFDGSML